MHRTLSEIDALSVDEMLGWAAYFEWDAMEREFAQAAAEQKASMNG